MSNEQYALMDRSKVPSRERWQDAIKQCGFDLQLDPEMKPFEDSGFSPCTLMGEETGVEIDYDDSPEMMEDFRDIAPGKDCCVSFRWGGDLLECACAMIASYALAKHFGAVVSYEGEDPYSDLDEFLKETREIVKEAVESGED